MILQGILVQSLGQYCIRGVARLADLEQLSTVDKDYQRNLIDIHRAEMEEFLQGPDLFFPEVLLSYHFKDVADPFSKLQEGKGVGTATSAIRFTVKKVATKVNGVVQPTARYVTIEIDEGRLVGKDGTTPTYPFFRIDGNHRLSAAASLDKSSTIGNLNTPFCLLLLLGSNNEQEANSRRFERTVFYNVNSKSVPLTHEQILRVVLDASSQISNEQLEAKFGLAHLYARQQQQHLRHDRHPHIEAVYRPALPHSPGHERHILWQLHQLLEQHTGQRVASDARAQTDDAFKRIDSLYAQHERLRNSKSLGLLLAFLYYAFRESEPGGSLRLTDFAKWILQNHFCEIETLKADSLITLFDQLTRSRGREVFISMPFRDNTNVHLTAFQKVIDDINRDRNDPLPLTLKRSDGHVEGVTYQIADKILERIRVAGLLIADLSGNNANVFHEVGYLMGLVAHNQLEPANLILVCNMNQTDPFPANVGFNLRGYKILAFQDTATLLPALKAEIEAYYYAAPLRGIPA